MTYDTTKNAIQLHTKQNTSRVWETGINGERIAVGAPGDVSRDWIVRTAYSSIGVTANGDFPSAAGDSTFQVLPVGRFVVPTLRRTVLVKWDILGDYSNTAPDAESLEAQLMVNGAAVDTALAYPQTAQVTSMGALRFTADLSVIGNLTSQRFLTSTKMQIVNASGTSIISTEKFIFSTIDHLADNVIGWKIRKTFGGTAVMNIHSIMCYQLKCWSGA